MLVAASAVAIAGLALVPFREIARDSASPEGVAASIAFATPYMAAGGLAVRGTVRGRFALVTCVGMSLLPISIVSIVMIPVTLPAAVLIAMGAQHLRSITTTEWLIAAITGFGIVASFFALLVHHDPASWTTSTGSGSTSDVITNTEIVVSLAILGASCLLGLTLPPSRRS